MANLLWSMLNVAAALGLLYNVVQATRLLRQRFGLAMALSFMLGIVVLGCRDTHQPTDLNANLLVSRPPDLAPANGSATHTIPLGGGVKLTLLAEYYQETGVVKPRGLYPVIVGLVIGHRWRPVAGLAEQAGRQLRYLAVMEHTWLLLGVPVFKQTHEYTGTMPLATL